VAVAFFMESLDTTILNTALPTMASALHVAPLSMKSVLTSYTLSLAVFIPVSGWVADRFGTRRVFTAAIGLFTLGSILCGVSTSLHVLVLCRLLQGCGGAMMVPVGRLTLVRTFPKSELVQAMSFVAIPSLIGPTIGPLAGGLIVSYLHWRAIFFVNVPLAIAALAIGLHYLPRDAPVTPRARIDLISIALSMAGGFALVYPLIEGRQHGWPAWSFAMLASGLVLLAMFARHQAQRARHGRAPLVMPSILRRRSYVAGLAVIVGFIGAMGGMMIALNVMFQTGLGYSPLASGIATAAIPVAAIGGSITSSLLLERLGRTTMHIGIVTMGIGLAIVCVVLSAAGAELGRWDLVGPLVVTGFGMGMVFVPMFDVILAAVEPHEIGSASGLLESVQQLSMSVGIAVVGTVLFDRLGDRHGPGAFVAGAGSALLVTVAFLAAAAAAVCWLPKHARATG
jgi:EmrB/QacA subfamily drug resistance transporter